MPCLCCSIIADENIVAHKNLFNSKQILLHGDVCLHIFLNVFHVEIYLYFQGCVLLSALNSRRRAALQKC